MRTFGFCRSHKRWRPCGPCHEASQRQSEVWRTPERRASHVRSMVKRGVAWSAAEDNLLREMAGHLPAGDIAREFRTRGYRRTKGAIWTRAEQAGLDMFRKGIAFNELRLTFGVADNTVRGWMDLGLLRGQAYGLFWVFSIDEVEKFIRERPWAYDVDRMPNGRLRQLAAVVRQRDPYLRLSEIARAAHCDLDTVRARFHSGEIEGHQRQGPHGAIMIRASAIPTLQASVRAAIKLRQRGLQLIPGARYRVRQRAEAAA